MIGDKKTPEGTLWFVTRKVQWWGHSQTRKFAREYLLHAETSQGDLISSVDKEIGWWGHFR
jgi:hypothetical protein